MVKLKSLIKIEKLYLIKYENKQEQVMNKKIKISYPWTSIGIVTFSFVLLLSGYTIWSTKVWFGNIFDLTQREGISATNFLYSHQDFIDDIGAIDYINKNDNRKLINIVEATGISYTSDCKLSTFTGANTIMGWHTHELLWKNNEELINNRTLEVENFYKNGNVEYCKNFIDKYNVDYIFIGTVEKEKYDIDINMLINLGEVVWQNNEKELYLIKINN